MTNTEASRTELLTIAELAEALQVSERMIRDACRSGKLRATVKLNRMRRFDLDDVKRQLGEE